MIKFLFHSPKANSDVLTDFAKSADFGKKGGEAKRTSEEKHRSATGIKAEHVFPKWLRNSKR